MADIFSEEKRSAVMKAVKSKYNKSTELKLIQIFKKLGIKGWRRNYKIFGKPDFIFIRFKIALFTDGCFWHGHDCRNVTPKHNEEYWNRKIQKNKIRDRFINGYLKKKGWMVFRIWECDIKKEKLPHKFLKYF